MCKKMFILLVLTGSFSLFCADQTGGSDNSLKIFKPKNSRQRRLEKRKAMELEEREYIAGLSTLLADGQSSPATPGYYATPTGRWVLLKKDGSLLHGVKGCLDIYFSDDAK